MSEIKVGEYVRNKYGIAKVIDIENNNGIDVLVFDKNICFLVNKETGEIKEDKLFNKLAIIEDIDIEKIKHSSYIIDLIKIGDYVDGHRVIEVSGNSSSTKEVYCEDEPDFGLWETDIGSIVTKEQFERMEYKVNE